MFCTFIILSLTVAGGTDYTDNKDYIDNIMEIVSSKIESDDEIAFDASDLFT